MDKSVEEVNTFCERHDKKRELSVDNYFGDEDKIGAGNETRTRDPDLGKVVLYQLSYSRIEMLMHPAVCLTAFGIHG